jgi:secretion/DNA translocation related CpaE-like protein
MSRIAPGIHNRRGGHNRSARPPPVPVLRHVRCVAGGIGILTDDAATAADLSRLCAVAGASAEIGSDPATTGGLWRRAALLFLDVAQARALVGLDRPRRPGVVLVATELGSEVWRLAVTIGAEEVLRLPDDEPRLVDRVAMLAEPAPRARMVATVPVSGGAGASTLAVLTALASRAAVATPAVALVDLDADAGGLDLLLGAEQLPGARWPDLDTARGVVPAAGLAAALPQAHGVRIVAPARDGSLAPPAEVVASVLAALQRACDLLVVDLPRSSLFAAELLPAVDRLVLVATADVRSAVAAARAAAAVRPLVPDLALVVRTRPSDRLAAVDVATAAGIELTGSYPTERQVAEAADRGALGSLRRTRIERCARDLLCAPGAG